MPVSLDILLPFILATAIFLAIPGPTIVLVVSQALSHGRSVALASALGVGFGDLCAATLSLIGVGTLLATSATAFVALKWIGAAYLVFLGVRMWRSPITDPSTLAAGEPKTVTGGRIFRAAFLVTLLNPKSIVFFIAFLPQFIDPAHAFAPQAATLVAVFVVLGVVNAYAYTLLASSARRVIARPRVLRAATRLGASVLIGAGFASALARRA
ncbi:LysE family translocator [Consotaella aegiceratis]|uniref:LysE family translocator n=1 Tax=Consotaella aegiceratis TaxID=3097961 RepID=UPI002F3E872C